MGTSYDKEALRLSKLPRAERFEQLLEFPCQFAFKVIGSGERFRAKAIQCFVDLGYGDVVPVERASAKGRYVALTFTLDVQSGAEIDRAYTSLEAIEGLTHIL